MDLIGDDLVGTLTAPLLAGLRAKESTCGVRLRPGAFTALYGVPASALAGLRLPLSDVVRPRPLLELAAEADEPDPVASMALHAPNLRVLARTTGYSERHLRRRVLTATGHTPGTLRRIGRMQRTLAAGRGESWACSAAAAGYHDESHMINDFRALAGGTPRELLDGRFLQGADA
jgi:AraC-like DNA-binding protein